MRRLKHTVVPVAAAVCVCAATLAGTVSASAGASARPADGPTTAAVTSTSVACPPGPGPSSEPVFICTATVTDAGADAVSTGSVSFSVSPSTPAVGFGPTSCVLEPTSGDAASCSVNLAASVTASGTFTVTAGYSGGDEFDASSGTTSVSVSGQQPTNNRPSGIATVTHVRTAGAEVVIDATCPGEDTCPALRITATVVEHLRGRAVVAVTPFRTRPATPIKVITIAAATRAAPNGIPQNLVAPLNKTGTALLERYQRLRATVLVTSGTQASERRTVARATVTFVAP